MSMSQEAPIFQWSLRRKILLLAMSALFLFLCFWNLAYSPATWFDEGINVNIAKSLAAHGVYSLPLSPEKFVQERSYLITTNFPVLLPVACFVRLFGSSFFVARLPMVIFLVLFVATVFQLVRKLFDTDYALMGVALLISFVPLYGDGKAVLGEVPGLFYLLAALLLLLAENVKTIRLFLSGVLFGLAIASKPFFLIILPALLIGEAYRYFQTKKILWRRLFWLGAGLTLPLIIWFFTLLSSFSWSGVLGMFRYYSNSYAASDFIHLISANLFRFLSERTPLHFLLLFLAVAIGLYIRLKKGSRPHEVEIILLSLVLINIFWYLKTPGWYRYFFIAHLILLSFAPAFLGQCVRKKIVMVLVALLFFAQLAYLVSKRHDTLYYSDGAQAITQVVQKMVPQQDKILVIDSPSVAFLLNNYSLYQFLQINPTLFFGTASLKDENGIFFPFILANATVEKVSIDKIAEILETQYQVAGWNYQYTLYKKK